MQKYGEVQPRDQGADARMGHYSAWTPLRRHLDGRATNSRCRHRPQTRQVKRSNPGEIRSSHSRAITQAIKARETEVYAPARAMRAKMGKIAAAARSRTRRPIWTGGWGNSSEFNGLHDARIYHINRKLLQKSFHFENPKKIQTATIAVVFSHPALCVNELGTDSI